MKKLFIFLLLLFGCKKIDQEGMEIFTIYEGTHRSTFKYRSTNSTYLEFEVKFDSSAIYKTTIEENQADINKLFGVSDCKSHHMDNSIRFGWRYYNERLQLLWFKHENEVFTYGFITYIKPNVNYICSIDIQSEYYVLCVNNTCEMVPRNCGIRTNYNKYILWPYFGGDEPAPHDIKIRLKRL